MTAFDEVMHLALTTRRLSLDDATVLERRILGEAAESILEICQDSNQITLILASILKDQGSGTVTSFQGASNARRNEFSQAIRELGLQDNISLLPAGRSYTWALQRLLSSENPPEFDICVLNGNKTWDSIVASALLAHVLLRPGGLLVLTDVSWRMAGSPYFQKRPHSTQKYDADELDATPVQLAIDLLLPNLDYTVITMPEAKSFALARKS